MGGVGFEEVSSVDDSMLVGSETANPHFHRGPEVLNWMLRDKWVLESEHADQQGQNYFFSGFREAFRFIVVRLFRRQGGETLGFAIFSLSSKDGQRSIKLLDHHLIAQSLGADLLVLAFEYCRRFGASSLTLSGHLRGQVVDGWVHGRVIEMGQVHYFARPARKESIFATALERLELTYSDGDTAFT
jgi:hypothetical protein